MKVFFTQLTALMVFASMVIFIPYASAQAVEKQEPSITYMSKVASELLTSGKLSSVGGFQRAIKRHADFQSIGRYSLGRHRKNLKSSREQDYYYGVRRFMARYFAEQSKIHRVSRVEVVNNPRKSGINTLVRYQSVSSKR